MSLRIICSGSLVRYPLGGHSWHQLQYLAGFAELGHEVWYFEDYGWDNSCYDPSRDEMTADPGYGLAYLTDLLRSFGLEQRWCYLAQDGASHGMPRERLGDLCAECDVYFNLDNANWIPELRRCRRRALVDTDPAFTQIGVLGMGGPFCRYHTLFTYGENIHRPGCSVPTAGQTWLPTRQPVVLDLWPRSPGDPAAPMSSVINWTAYGDFEHEGRVYGQKDREFEPFFSLPSEVNEPMELAASAPAGVLQRLSEGGWQLANPMEVTRTTSTYQSYLQGSRGEFCVAKHGYVSTASGWFSERSTGYLAMGRPAVLQDTGFSAFLPTGEGLLAFRTPAEARAAIRRLSSNYDEHCRAARRLVEEYFDARRVLTSMLERTV